MNPIPPKRPTYCLFSIGIAAALFFAALPLSAQTVIGGDTIDVSAMLDVQGVDKGVLLPRLTTAQRNAMPAPARGLLIFNNDENCIQINTGSPLVPVWKCLGEGLPQTGNQTGNVLYWSGTAWVRLSPGQPGQLLALTQQGIPAWTGATFPVVSTEPITSINPGQEYLGGFFLTYEAQVGVNVSSDGGGLLLAKGVVCDTRDNPVISDVGGYASGDTSRIFQDVNLSGPGIFRGSVTSLLPSTTYKCRGFAMNSAGIVYGGQQSFTTPSAGMVGGLNCAGATFSNDLVAGISPDGTTISIPYTGGNGGLYTSQTVSSTGLTGLTASLAAGTLSLGPGSLQYVLTGTTPVAGTANFSISFGGQSCTVSRAVRPGADSAISQITMKNIPGGTFSMGCTTGGSNCFSNEFPVHTVTLSAFQIGETEVTQAQWQAVMGSNPSYFRGNNSRPVEYVSWYDVAVFCNRLSEAQGLTPCYYADSSFTQVYGKSGGSWSLPNSGNVYWNPSATVCRQRRSGSTRRGAAARPISIRAATMWTRWPGMMVTTTQMVQNL